MISFLSWAVSSSLALLAVLLLRLLLGRFLSPRGRMMLWTLAGLRLALPFSFPSPVCLPSSGTASASSPVQAAAMAVPLSPQVLSPETAAAPGGFPLWEILWLGGGFLLAFWLVLGMVHSRRKTSALPLLEEGELLSAARRCGALLGRDTLPEIRLGGRRPFTAGVLSPVVVLPEGLPPFHWEQALLHELFHWRNRDVLLTGLALALLCVHWYNPLAWLAFFAWRADLELRCDSQVVAITGRRQDYAQLLLSCTQGGWFPSAAVMGGAHGLKERIRALGRRLPAAQVTVPVTLLAVVILTICLGNPTPRTAGEASAAPGGSHPPTAYEAWKEALQSSFSLIGSQFQFSLPNSLPEEGVILSLEGEWVTGEERRRFLSGEVLPSDHQLAFPLPDPPPESIFLSATFTDPHGKPIYFCSFFPSLDALTQQSPPYGDGEFDPQDWLNQAGESIGITQDGFLCIGLPAGLPEGWRPQVRISGRLPMGEDSAMSWHDDDFIPQPGQISYRELPAGLLDLIVDYSLLDPAGRVIEGGAVTWEDDTAAAPENTAHLAQEEEHDFFTQPPA